MSAATLPRMTADEFIAWAMEQPETEHYELVAGEVVAMAPERAVHARAKLQIAMRLADAIQRQALQCEVYGDGMAVQIDETTIYAPDALLRCGPRLPDEAVKVLDPVIVVEVVSPSSRSRDTNRKLSDYFRLPSLRHYLVVAADIRTVIHHHRRETGEILTRIVREGPIELDPPGIVLDGIFPADPER
jgi:Uma2 family endonuclease